MSIWNETNKALALAEAERWRGVPHHDRMANFPVGVDCIHYVGEILFAASVLERRELPFYNPGEGIAQESSMLEDRLIASAHASVLTVDAHEPEFGDVVIFKTGRLFASHCGWLAGRHLYHALANRCVTRSEWQHWRHKAKVLIRFYERGWR